MSEFQSLESCLTRLGDDALKNIWGEPSLKLAATFGPAGKKRPETLARDLLIHFDTQILGVKPIRDALLVAEDFCRASGKLVKAKPGLTKKFKKWPDLLYPKWLPGSPSALRFCRAYNLDPIWAGEKAPPTKPALEELEAPDPLRPLLPFQQRLSNKIYQVISKTKPQRAMATLPTGAGKTRTALDAILRFQEEQSGIVLWIANSQEVCEQAASAYKSVYEGSSPGFESSIHRLWGNYQLNTDFEQGFMVASVQKLHNELQNKKTADHLSGLVNLVVFDEAHQAMAPTYKKVLTKLAGAPKTPKLPLLGLTATPGVGINGDIKKLVQFFDAELLIPYQFKDKNPVEWLQKIRVLSRTVTARVDGLKNFTLTAKEWTHFEQFSTFSPSLLKRIGEDATRNDIILKAAKTDKKKKTLIFACDIAQANRLAAELRKSNITARAITSGTHASLRRKWIASFKSDEANSLKVLVNVGVLTTGFDAPKIEGIIMARPTSSRILFEQMVGRGLRGPLFGGSKKCTIIDIVDSFSTFGAPKGFQTFEQDWLQGKR